MIMVLEKVNQNYYCLSSYLHRALSLVVNGRVWHDDNNNTSDQIFCFAGRKGLRLISMTDYVKIKNKYLIDVIDNLTVPIAIL